MARIEINLLPRELRRKRRGISFDKSHTLVAAGVGILIVIMVGVSILQGVKLNALDQKIAQAQRKTDELRKSIELVDALAELKDKVLQRMSAIEALDRNRVIWVRILEDLSRRVPDYLWLTLLREDQPENASVSDTSADSTTSSASIETVINRVTLEGYSYSLNSLASFLIELMGSRYFGNMELEYVKRAEISDKKIFSFQLAGDLHYAPEIESPEADSTEYKLALGSENKGSETN